MTKINQSPRLAEDFSTQGFLEFTELEKHRDAYALYDKIYRSRPFDKTLFLSETQWQCSGKSHKHTNPRPGRNFLEILQNDLDFIEKHPTIQSTFQELLGSNFRWSFKRVICRLPRDILPEWVNDLIGSKPANTLNAFIHPEYRDISYYLETDLHQDILDYSRVPEDKREHRVLFFYVHLNDVTTQDAPLYLLPKTHKFGVSSHQHNVCKIDDTYWRYTDDYGRSMETTLYPVLGPAGHIAVWHSCLLHGARPLLKGKPRLVLLYMLAQSLGTDDKPCGLEMINAEIQGDLYPKRDYTPGLSAKADGSWNLRETDFTRL